MKGLLTKLGATTATSPFSNGLYIRREVKDEFDAWLSVPETRQVNATSTIDHRYISRKLAVKRITRYSVIA